VNVEFVVVDDGVNGCFETVDVEVPCLPCVGDLVYLDVKQNGQQYHLNGSVTSVTWAVLDDGEGTNTTIEVRVLPHDGVAWQRRADLAEAELARRTAERDRARDLLWLWMKKRTRPPRTSP